MPSVRIILLSSLSLFACVPHHYTEDKELEVTRIDNSHSQSEKKNKEERG